MVINATSIGLADAEAKLALDLNTLTAEMVVADVIPNPPRTKLVRDAEAKGCTVIDGLGMLVNQGITGIEYWTGETVDGNVMRARLEELFGALIVPQCAIKEGFDHGVAFGVVKHLATMGGAMGPSKATSSFSSL